ncbi:MAG: outer membrane lipoprotein chaperone LolA [Thermomonas sp.]|uniref:outer membrane lipoprotein chaperone LolA n=1 Tax=Thermomonas sp. TaxID=1971895 RepID=UPI001EC738E9|nr:outer membrane lipoprotein chaperone LolA [Thermomonas sp.]MBV2210070.1 outer membrane lipoprotein chaperone LolA [Thermomonas sp.]
MNYVVSIMGAALMLATSGAYAGARDQLNAFTHGLKGLDGQFSQQVFSAQGKPKENTSGRVAVSAPRLFRWEYVTPYEQLIVADGKTVWVYDPDLSQVSKRPQGAEEANSPLAILLEPARLDRDFNVKEAGTNAGMEWLDIAPRAAEAAFKRARLGFSNNQLAQLDYTDALGQRTVIVFSHLQRNPAFNKAVFTFTPPKGVDVIGQ